MPDELCLQLHGTTDAEWFQQRTQEHLVPQSKRFSSNHDGLDALVTHTNEVLVDGGRVAVLLPFLRSGGGRVGKNLYGGLVAD